MSICNISDRRRETTSFALQELRENGAMTLYTTPNDAQFPVEEDKTDSKRWKLERPDTSPLKHEPPIYLKGLNFRGLKLSRIRGCQIFEHLAGFKFREFREWPVSIYISRI